MTPFPETEIMTIKRLEVALRKMDLKLLKDGAYKLHEKYHSGFKFEYLDLLKEIFADVSNNPSIPEDIKDILTPTIEDILASQGVKTDVTTSPYDSMNHNRVSSLTSLSYNSQEHNEEQNHEEHRISAFDAFNGQRNNAIHQNLLQGNFPINQPIQEPKQDFQTFRPIENPSVEEHHEENKQEYHEYNQENQNNVETSETSSNTQIDTEQNNKEEVKSIAIFYSQDSSNEKIKNILKYRELILKTKDEHTSINDILGLISEINIQSNTNVSELKGILEQLKLRENKVNLITNSLSANLINLFKENQINYSLFNSKEEKINLLPLFGLTNLFKCNECGQEYLDDSFEVMPLILQCPKCKNPMFPEFFSNANGNCEINIDFYNQSLVALANSKVWFLIHPSLEDSTSMNLLKSALSVSNQVQEIFIVDKDINIRETYKNIFQEINKEVTINAQINTLEDFFNSIG